MEKTPCKLNRNIRLEKSSTPFHIPPSPLMKTLGYGTGVNVYRLDRSPKAGQIRSPWAVKRVTKRECPNKDAYKSRIIDEAEILKKLSHPNIIGFRGITKSENGIENLALECCNTSLGMILEERLDNEMGPLPAKLTLTMITDIAKALDYLHTNAKLIHGDIKSHNILVKGDFEICKLCDFGVSLSLNDNGIIDLRETPQLRYIGTTLWTAPEIIEEEYCFDAKVDIFSFGLVIYETIALVPPHTTNVNDDDSEIEIQDEEVPIVDSTCGTRPPLPQSFELNDEHNIIVELFYCCTNELPAHRPSANLICKSIELLKKSSEI